MAEFPKLNPNQYALSFADYNTGHVLDINLNLLISNEQTEFLIFNSINEAENHAHMMFTNSKKSFEYYIYDNNEKLLKSERFRVG